MTPRFSVIIPCYNRANIIGPCLASVQAQSMTDFECIIVDDGSDDSVALAQVVLALNDPRFRVIRRENGGGGAARNTGIAAARADWIAFLDSDDEFLPHKLAHYAEALNTCDTNTVLFSQSYVNRGLPQLWIRPKRAPMPHEGIDAYLLCNGGVILTSTLLVHRELLGAVNFDPTLRRFQDPDLVLRLAKHGAVFKMIGTPLSLWNDTTERDRASRLKGYHDLEYWLQAKAWLLSSRGLHGFRATVLAYNIAHAQPFSAFWMIWSAWMTRAISTRMAMHQTLRSFLPRQAYRKLINSFVGMFGKQRHHIEFRIH